MTGFVVFLNIYIYIYIYIYIVYIYIYIYKVYEDCDYPKNECSMHGYSVQNIPAEQKIYICIKTRNLEIVFHLFNRFIKNRPFEFHQTTLNKRKKLIME